MERYLHGFHDIGGEHLHGGKPGWTIVTEEVGLNTQARGGDYTSPYGIVVRINTSHQGQGTIPLPHQYEEGAAAMASFIASSQGVEYWAIGNEFNHEGERPQGVVISPENYCQFYEMAYAMIMRVKPDAKIMPGALAPYHAAPTDWLEYARYVYGRLAGKYQAVNIHAYARSARPEDIPSEEKMGPPLETQYKGFRTFEDLLGVIPIGQRHLPALITEFNIVPGPWPNQNTGVIRAMYDYVNHWNNTPGTQKVIASLCFRFKSGLNHPIDWGMEDKPNLLQDFAQAASIGYMSPREEQEEPVKVFIPGVGTGTPAHPAPPGKQERSLAPGITEDFLQRTKAAVTLVADKPRYFALIEADYVPNGAQVFGPDHHILVDVLDTNGKRMMGQPVVFQAGNEPAEVKAIDKKEPAYGVDFPMFRAGYGHFVFVGGSPSDLAGGMGLGTTEQPDWNHHVDYRLVFQERVGVPVPAPAPGSSSEAPLTGDSDFPSLVHPVVNPQYRGLTQGFGERPSFYAQYKIDGVPLKGHEGTDYATPVGSEIQAVDEGKVAEVGDQGKKGYGKWIKVIHEWGETVYAHLEEQWVKVGDQVKQGQRIGLTGATGNVSGPHLHFGLRPYPADRRDGWGGYRDPAPFLKESRPASTPGQGASPERSELVRIVKEAAQEFGLNWRLLSSLIHGESSFNPSSRNSKTGAAGLGNIMPLTWSEWAPKVGATNILDAKDNARVTAAYLAWCIKTAGSVRKGLWAYNWGIGNVLGLATPILLDEIPEETIEFASKVIHGAELLEIVGA